MCSVLARSKKLGPRWLHRSYSSRVGHHLCWGVVKISEEHSLRVLSLAAHFNQVASELQSEAWPRRQEGEGNAMRMCGSCTFPLLPTRTHYGRTRLGSTFEQGEKRGWDLLGHNLSLEHWKEQEKKFKKKGINLGCTSCSSHFQLPVRVLKLQPRHPQTWHYLYLT